MARTRAENFDDIKATILSSAAQLFAQKGFRNTNIIDIGNACNASKSRMYHYFGSKELMLEAMLLEHVNGLLAIAREITETEADPRKNSSPLCSLISGITTQRPIVTRSCWPMPNICPRRRKPRYVARSIAWWSFSS